MLHEVLLALSGHPSPLFDKEQLEEFPLVSPAERALLTSIGRLANLNRALRAHVALIAKQHPSVICKAVANGLQVRHLAAFQRAILQTEKEILSSDSRQVGAYNIVPLASIVSSFSEWRRRLDWYWDLARFMVSSDAPFDDLIASTSFSHGPALINKLRAERNTGYPDIEAAATDLSKTAELTWLRLLSAWLLEGSKSKMQSADFFMQNDNGKDILRSDLLPEFLTPDLAASLHYVGKTLNYINVPQSSTTAAPLSSNTVKIADRTDAQSASRAKYVQLLSKLDVPLSVSEVSHAVSEIRSLLFTHLNQSVLPVDKLVDTLEMLRNFFFARKSNFASTLITEADQYLRSRSSQMSGPRKTANALAGIVMRDSEASRVLVNTWIAMGASLRMDQTVDPQLEWARENVLLTLGGRHQEGQDKAFDVENAATSQQVEVPKDVFCHFLLSTPAHLSLAVKAPMDLFLGSKDVEAYSLITSYLLAIRRAHLHATNLWKQSLLRKGASLANSTRSSYKYRMYTSKKLRERSSKRERAMRAVWATLSSAIFLLTELGEYLNSEVIAESWQAFYVWFRGHDHRPRSVQSNGLFRPAPTTSRPHTSNGDNMSTAEAFDQRPGSFFPDVGAKSGQTLEARHDPELLSEAHRQYLSMLLETLLLTKEQYTKALHTLLTRLDQLVALVLCLQSVQNNLDLHDEGVDDGFSDKYASEEREVLADMHTAREKVKSAARLVIEQLRGIDAAPPSIPKLQDAREKTGFEPWNDNNVDRLLMRLDLKLSLEESRLP